MLCTHDHFTVDEDGFLYFVGRTDDIIKTRGEKVSPLEVETAIHHLEGVREAAVVGAPDPILGEAIVAFVAPQEGCALTEAQVRKHCEAHLQHVMTPKRVVLLDALPKTPNGKIDKSALKRMTAP
jgi:acyl-coenzyme A synthetase/AMP-(fatty) acid ligase